MYTKIFIASALASIAAAANYNSTTVVGDIGTTTITVTSCSQSSCTATPVVTGVTVVTETLSGTVTQYTTYCPLPSSPAPAPAPVPENGTTTTPPGVSVGGANKLAYGGAAAAGIAGLLLL